MRKYSLAIHGGAGTIRKAAMTPAMEKEYLQALSAALAEGYQLLEKGMTAREAVIAAVKSMEDCILFNAGRGSVFTHEGRHEMDAAIMDGKSLRAGAIAGVQFIKNPIELAQAVMDHSEHVMLSGEGALQFARMHNISIEEDAYFYYDVRYKQLLSAQSSGDIILDHHIAEDKKFGTVGAVACDRNGNLAAATSTGGMTNKRFNRIGDSPLIGSGTYANNKTCAISCTGHGERFIEAVAAYDVSCLMEYKGLSLDEAMKFVVQEKLVAMNGEGGMIGVDPAGNCSMQFNSEGMYRGMKDSEGNAETLIYQ
ncbi:MAG: beta-aspartyl-peptidase [Terrimonas sp.]|nr:beta-aspartyl-peptidase [Terrimonas sp.]